MKKFLLFLFTCSAPALFAQSVTVTVRNPLNVARTGETVELDYHELQTKARANTYSEYLVTDAAGDTLPSQIIYEQGNVPQKLIFQASVPPRGEAHYTLTMGEPAAPAPKTFGRFAPERYDDYIWENDRIAYRIYGKALMPIDGPSNGIDVIVKRTPDLLMNELYRLFVEHRQSYHEDHGKGVDAYKVGRSLGCGALAPFAEGRLWLGDNFVTCRTLDNGPVRTSVALHYDTLLVNGTKISETRIISLDAGTQFNKVVTLFGGAPAAMPVAAGIALKNAGKTVPADKADPQHPPVLAPDKGYIAYSETGDKARPHHDNGTIYTAVVFPQALHAAKVEQQHVLAISACNADGQTTHYTGAGWSKWGFATPAEWLQYVETFAQCLRQPLQVELRVKN